MTNILLAFFAVAALIALSVTWWRYVPFARVSRYDEDHEHGLVVLSALWLIAFGGALSSANLLFDDNVDQLGVVMGRGLIRGALLTVAVYLWLRVPGWGKKR